MFNYLKSEWYRTFRQRRLWVLLGAISLLGALYYLLAFYAFNWQQPGIEAGHFDARCGVLFAPFCL